MKCRKGYNIQICKSPAGYYLGTLDENGCPNCRISTKYASSLEEAKSLSVDRLYAMEVQWCNGGEGCLPSGI